MKSLRTIMTLVFCLALAAPALASNLMYGCMGRPACGKMCKLVCETKTLTVVAYGCKCDEVCIPAPSKACCTHCTCCCPDSACGCGEACGCGDTCGCGDACGCGGKGCAACCDMQPKAKFCWRDWLACGCAKPRKVKKLTAYEVTKEVNSYHWEVVDGCDCCDACGGCGEACEPACGCVYKPAPANAPIGSLFELTEEEQSTVAAAYEK